MILWTQSPDRSTWAASAKGALLSVTRLGLDSWRPAVEWPGGERVPQTPVFRTRRLAQAWAEREAGSAVADALEWLEHQFSLAASARAKMLAGDWDAITDEERRAAVRTSAYATGRVAVNTAPPRPAPELRQVSRWHPGSESGSDDWRTHP